MRRGRWASSSTADGPGDAPRRAAATTAREAGKRGERVLLVEQTAHLGGRALVDGGDVEALIAELEAMENVEIRTRIMGAGVYDHGYALAYERVADHRPGLPGAPRHRAMKVLLVEDEKTIAVTLGDELEGALIGSIVR